MRSLLRLWWRLVERSGLRPGFASGSSAPTVRAVRVILKRGVRFLARGVEFPDMPRSVSILIGVSTH